MEMGNWKAMSARLLLHRSIVIKAENACMDSSEQGRDQ